MAFLTEKNVLITGGCGTIGREMVFQVLDQDPAEVRVMDTNESEIFFLEQAITDRLQGGPSPSRAHCYVGDVRDADKMYMLTEGIDVVLHLAGLKHVILCERSPFDAVQTNVCGVKNVVNAALAHDVERVIFTSSDKAVNPTNVMGTSKLMGERLITAANSLKIKQRTIFSSTRFGNVLGSRGSVVPIFARQIQSGGPVTLTHSEMTRFVMTVDESCRLVLRTAEIAQGGEVFVTKMPTVCIADLAAVMIDMLAERCGYHPHQIEVAEIGVKPGEKLYEELMSHEETRRTYELEEMFAVLPAFRSVYEDIQYSYPDVVETVVDQPYISSPSIAMSREEIKSYFQLHGILDTILGEVTSHQEVQNRPRLRLAA